MEENKKFNLFIFLFKMAICSVLWTIIAYITLFYMPYFPHRLLTVQFNPDAIFSVELSHLLGFFIVFTASYILTVKGGVYSYTFERKTKKPFLLLFFNVIWGSGVCFLVSRYAVYNDFQALFIAGIFALITIINYFLFFARYGWEYRENVLVEDWHKAVSPPLVYLKKENKKDNNS